MEERSKEYSFTSGQCINGCEIDLAASKVPSNVDSSLVEFNENHKSDSNPREACKQPRDVSSFSEQFHQLEPSPTNNHQQFTSRFGNSEDAQISCSEEQLVGSGQCKAQREQQPQHSCALDGTLISEVSRTEEVFDHGQTASISSEKYRAGLEIHFDGQLDEPPVHNQSRKSINRNGQEPHEQASNIQASEKVMKGSKVEFDFEESQQIHQSSSPEQRDDKCQNCEHLGLRISQLQKRNAELQSALKINDSYRGEQISYESSQDNILGEYIQQNFESPPPKQRTKELAESHILERNSKQTVQQGLSQSLAINSSKVRKESYGILGSAQKQGQSSRSQPDILSSNPPIRRESELRMITSVQEASKSCEESVVIANSKPRSEQAQVEAATAKVAISSQVPQQEIQLECRDCPQLKNEIEKLQKELQESRRTASAFQKKPYPVERIQYVQQPTPENEKWDELQKACDSLRQRLKDQIEFGEFLIKVLTKCDHYYQMFVKWSTRIDQSEQLFKFFANEKQLVLRLKWEPLGKAVDQLGQLRKGCIKKSKQLASSIYWRCITPVRALIGDFKNQQQKGPVASK